MTSLDLLYYYTEDQGTYKLPEIWALRNGYDLRGSSELSENVVHYHVGFLCRPKFWYTYLDLRDVLPKFESLADYPRYPHYAKLIYN